MTLPLPSEVQQILKRFDDAGYEAYCVGGCVRDALRGVLPNDWDICTAAPPDVTLSLFSDKPCLDIGIRHGTVVVVWDGHPVEITTYRIDGVYVGYRTPEHVTFSASLQEDCLRRDFTVNAMAYHPVRGLQDFFGGQRDLAAGMIRCVGCAGERFAEDALRILRALRFASVLNFSIDSETAAALHSHARLLSAISGERIAAEWKKFLSGDGRRAAWLLAAFWDVFAVVLPLPDGMPSNTLDALQNAFLRVHLPHQRFAALLYLCGCRSADTRRAAVQALPFERVFSDAVTWLVRNAEVQPPISRIDMRHRLSQTPSKQVTEQLALHGALFPHAQAACNAAIQLCRDCVEAGDVTQRSALAVSGRDLTALGFSGKAVGSCLSALLTAVIEERLPNDREMLLHAAKQYL